MFIPKGSKKSINYNLGFQNSKRNVYVEVKMKIESKL